MTRPVVGNQKLYSHPIVFIPNRKKRIDFSFMSIAFLSENMLSVCIGKNDIYGVLAREVTSFKSQNDRLRRCACASIDGTELGLVA